AANLSEAFYQSVIGRAKGTRLERQELEGELLDDVENALWSRDLLERIQVPPFGQPGGDPTRGDASTGGAVHQNAPRGHRRQQTGGAIQQRFHVLRHRQTGDRWR
ncbi:MAG: hypothetical protein WCJ73_08940, partial [Actinomycetes bacterium]